MTMDDESSCREGSLGYDARPGFNPGGRFGFLSGYSLG